MFNNNERLEQYSNKDDKEKKFEFCDKCGEILENCRCSKEECPVCGWPEDMCICKKDEKK